MGGRFRSFDQLYKKFSGNDVFPSPKLNEHQKKKEKNVFAGNWSHFSLKSGKDQKKGLRRNLLPFSVGNLRNLLVLAGYFSSGHPALNTRWEYA